MFVTGVVLGLAGGAAIILGSTVAKTEDSTSGNTPESGFDSCEALRSNPVYAGNQCSVLKGPNTALVIGGAIAAGAGVALAIIGAPNSSVAFGPGMVTRGWGRVINLASVLGVIALAGRAPYASSKAGVINLTRVLALEWAGTGVTANAICPGAFATEMNRQLLDDPVKYKEFVSRIPMGRWGELDEMSGAVVFLASPAASYVTGSALFVDGGWTAR